MSRRMGTIVSVTVFSAVLLASAAKHNALATEVASGENGSMYLDGRLQLLGMAELLDDPWKDSTRFFLFLRQARLNVHGTLKGCEYGFLAMFGGEEKAEANSVMSLLDAFVDVPFGGETFGLKLGQFKVPAGRERLLDSGAMLFTERSVQNLFFNIGRDVGFAAHTDLGALEAAVGVFTGGGMDIPQRYIPEDLGIPMVAGRVGVNTGLDKNVFTPYQNDKAKGTGTRFAAYLNGAYTKDSRVGHSTPLIVKYYDTSLFLQESWNQYLVADANEPANNKQKAVFSQYGGDLAIEVPVAQKTVLQLSVEANFAEFSNDYGSLKAGGGVASAHLIVDNWSLGLRYAMVDPSGNWGYTYTDAQTKKTTFYPIEMKTIQEYTAGLTYSFKEYGVKVVADITKQIDVPFSKEVGHGLYNLALQPGSISSIRTGGYELGDTLLGRLVVQYDF